MPQSEQSIVSSNAWTAGMNSLLNPVFLPRNQLQATFNMVNRGGIYACRPGYALQYDATRQFEARGFILFKPKGQVEYLVKAIGQSVRVSPYPFTAWTDLGITLDPLLGPVHFEVAVKGLHTDEDGLLQVLDAKPVLMIQTGETRAWMWDGNTIVQLDPGLNQTPIGTWMKWSGNRLWVVVGNKIYASNLLAPDQFLNDGSQLSGAGYFSLPDDCTGMGVTPDENSLLAFTTDTTTAFQSNILDRSQWLSTPEFQKVILPSIGCVAGRTIVSQWGMLWWLSQGGLVGLDDALTAFRSSRIHYRDNEMALSKANLSDDISGACAGAFENFLVLSVPSGDTYNAHTWVMDQGIVEAIEAESPRAWASIWTGTFPVQWTTKSVQGKTRCFFLSRGRYGTSTSNAAVSDVWEAFTSLQKEVTYSSGGVRSLQDIEWSMLTGFLSDDARFKSFGYIEIMMVELARTITVQAAYASRHSGFKQVLSKQIIASVDSFNNGAVDLNARIRQTRRLRSTEDDFRLTDKDPKIEDKNNRNRDRGFYVLVTGTGEAAVEAITLFANVLGDQPTGSVEANEDTIRYVNTDGDGAITDLTTTEPSIAVLPKSNIISSISPRMAEIPYSSL